MKSLSTYITEGIFDADFDGDFPWMKWKDRKLYWDTIEGIKSVRMHPHEMNTANNKSFKVGATTKFDKIATTLAKTIKKHHKVLDDKSIPWRKSGSFDEFVAQRDYAYAFIKWYNQQHTIPQSIFLADYKRKIAFILYTSYETVGWLANTFMMMSPDNAAPVFRSDLLTVYKISPNLIEMMKTILL